MACGAWERIFVGAACLFVLAGCRVASSPAAADPTAARRAAANADPPTGAYGASVRRGYALFANTPDSLPHEAPSALRCFSCHLDDGHRPNGLMLVGAYGRFPQYRARSGRVDLLSDRINDCFRRSLNGRAIAVDGKEMRDMTAYLAWISRGVGVLDSVPGAGLPRLPTLPGDTARGAALFAATCARCHGPEGAGGMLGTVVVPPLWGARSFNIGAGMARLRTAAAFIEWNMPFDKPGSLTAQQATDIATYVISRPRPDLPGKEADWPGGDPPPDVAYPTTAAQRRAAANRVTPTGAH